jgi:hypothetical protein
LRKHGLPVASQIPNEKATTRAGPAGRGCRQAKSSEAGIGDSGISRMHTGEHLTFLELAHRGSPERSAKKGRYPWASEDSIGESDIPVGPA